MEMNCGLVPLDIGYGFAYKYVTAHGGNPNQGEKHGIEEGDQAAQGQENECDQDDDQA
jgi:hypothetical protein